MRQGRHRRTESVLPRRHRRGHRAADPADGLHHCIGDGDLHTTPEVRAARSAPTPSAPTGVAGDVDQRHHRAAQGVDLGYDMLAVSVIGAGLREYDRPVRASRRRRDRQCARCTSAGSTGRCNVAEARLFVPLPRFELRTWADAVRRHRPKAVSLVPRASHRSGTPISAPTTGRHRVIPHFGAAVRR